MFVVIPVHDRLDFTRACLRSLHGQSFRDFRTVIIDDGSTDGTYAALKDEFPDTTVLWGDGDLWWAGAMNRGLEWLLPRARPDDSVLTLNNDTLPSPDYLGTLTAVSERHPLTLIGSVAVSSDDPERIVDGGERIDWTTGFSTRLARGSTWSEAVERYGEAAPVSVLSGRGTLIPIEVFRHVGLYDALRLPHYAADWEFARRAQRAGYPLLISYRARLQSHEGATGLRPSTQKLGFRDFVRAYVDIRSPNNLRTRRNFAKLCAEPGAYPVFITVDALRTIGGGLKWQILTRLPAPLPASGRDCTR